MNQGELIASLGLDLGPLRKALRTAREELRRFESVTKGAEKAPIKLKIDTSSIRSAEDSATRFNNELLKAGRTLASFAAIFYTLKNAFRVFSAGIEYQKTLEDTRLSLTGLIASLYDYRDSLGKAKTGVELFEAAQTDALKIQQEMRIAGIKTAATYEELMNALQQAFAPAKDAGVALGEMVPFVQRLTQIAQVAGVPMHQLNEEIRSFITGTMTRRTTRIMPFMESIGLGNEQIRKFIQSGTLFRETMRRTEQIAIMASRSTKTWTISLSNLYDAFRNILGMGLKGTFDTLKNLFVELTLEIVKTNDEIQSIRFNPTFLVAIKSIDKTFQSVLISARSFVKSVNEFQQAHPILVELGVDIGSIVVKLAALAIVVKTVVGAFGLIWRVMSSSIIGIFGQILKLAGKLELAWISVRIGWLNFVNSIKSVGLIVTIIEGLWAVVLRGVLVFTPLLAAIAKVSAVLLALSGVLALFGNYTIPNAAAKLWEWVKGWEILGLTIEERLSLATLSVRKFATYFGMDLKQVLNDVIGSFKEFGTILSAAFEGMIKIARTAFSKIIEVAKEQWEKLPQIMRDALSGALAAIVEFVNDAINYLKKPLKAGLIIKEWEKSAKGPFGEAFPEGDWVNEGVRAAKKFGKGWRDNITKETEKILTDSARHGLEKGVSDLLKPESKYSGIPKKSLSELGEIVGGGGAGQARRKYEELAREVQKSRREAESAKSDAWSLMGESRRLIIDYWAAQEKLRTESITKTSSMLEELLQSDLLTQEERTRYARQYSEIRLGLIDKEIEELRKLVIPEDVLESYRQLQEENVKTQVKTMEMGVALSRFIDETFTQMARDMQGHLSDSLYAIATQSESIGDVLQNIHNSMIRMMCDFSAKMITDWAANALKQIFSVQSALSGTAGIGGWLGKAVGFIGGLFGGGGGAAAGSAVSSNISRFAGAQFQTFGYAQGGVIPGHLEKIKAFQHGGIIDRPTLGVIGEGGKPELIKPLEDGKLPVEVDRGQFYVKLPGQKVPVAIREVNNNYNTARETINNFQRFYHETTSEIVKFAQGGVISNHFKEIVPCHYGNAFISPTLAMIAENRPETVLPLVRTSGGDLGVKAWIDQEPGKGKDRRPITINFNINTPDVESFRQNQNQISTKIMTVIRRSMRDV